MNNYEIDIFRKGDNLRKLRPYKSNINSLYAQFRQEVMGVALGAELFEKFPELEAVALARHSGTKQIIGFETLRYNFGFELGAAYIDPEHRGKHIFGTMTDLLLQEARSKGGHTVSVYVAAKKNPEKVVERLKDLGFGDSPRSNGFSLIYEFKG